MFRIHFYSAIRSLLKNREISIINIFGLVTGLTAFLFILHFIVYEQSFDTFFPDYKNIYRIDLKINSEGQNLYHGARSSRSLYYAIQNTIPGINANGIVYFENCLVRYKDIQLTDQNVLWADNGFEKVFSFQMISGKINFTQPLKGIVTESKARSLFGNDNPVGKILKVNEGMPVEITAVIKDLPSNTHLTADFFISMATFVHYGWISKNGDWHNNSYWNYVRLKPGYDYTDVEKAINSIAQKSNLNDNRKIVYYLQPLSDLHFANGLEGEMGLLTNKQSLFNLMVIAILTLMIAWINYVNLATAQSVKRLHELGLRKLIGASPFHLWLQSFLESFILNLAAVFISYMIYVSFLKDFSRYFNLPFSQAYIPIYIILISLLVVFVSGIFFSSVYHTFNLTGLNPVSAKSTGVHSGGFKKGLVIAQMVISTALIGSSMFVYKQIVFMKNSDLGINTENVVTLNGPASLNSDSLRQQRFFDFRKELLLNPEFISATANMFTPGQEPRYGFEVFKCKQTDNNKEIKCLVNNADDGLLRTFGLKLIAGNDFSGNMSENKRSVLISQMAIKALGFNNPKEAIDKKIYSNYDTNNIYTIVGILADFHNEGFQKSIYPVVYHTSHPIEFGYYSVRLKNGNETEAIDKMKTIWYKHYPTDPFHYFFADEFFYRQYSSETRFARLYLALTILSICIACLGLYGIVLFYLNQRRKEITIRRVNGAKISEIVYQINKNFVIWGLYSFVIACPIIYLVISQWLKNFEYQTKISWWVFVVSGLLSILIIIFTVSWQSWKAATRNPVESLRYE